MRRMLSVTIAALALTVIFVGCGGDGDKSFEVPGGGNVSVSDDVPDSFPDDLPVPDGADVQGSYSGSQGDVEGTVVTWEVDDGLDDVKALYERELGGDGPWRLQSSGDLGGSAFFTAESEDGSQAAYILLGESDGKTSLVITVGDNPEASDGSTDDGSTGDGDGDDAPPPDDGSADGSDGDAPVASLPEEVELSDDFPQDQVPIPSSARVTSSASFTNAGLTTFIVEFYSSQSTDEIADFYKSELEANGWTESFTSNVDGDVFASYTRDEGGGPGNDGVNLTISDSDVDGYVQVGLTVSLE